MSIVLKKAHKKEKGSNNSKCCGNEQGGVIEDVLVKPLRVLMVAKNFPPNFGGAEVQALRLAKELKQLGCKIDFISDNRKEPSAEGSFDGFRVYRFSSFFKGEKDILRYFVFSMRLLHFVLLHSNEYDVIHFHSISGYEALTIPFLKLLSKKIIVKPSLVGSDDPISMKSLKLGWFFFKALCCADKIIAISDRLFELSIKAGIDKKKVIFVPNGIDANTFFGLTIKKRKALKKRLGFDKFNVLFCTVGRLEERKNQEFLLRVWQYIQRELPSAAFLIIGPGNNGDNMYYRMLQELIHEMSLPNVFFMGKSENVDEYMKISDCFLFCSQNEGFANALLEAVFCSVFVVTKPLKGIAENIIRDESIGRICDTSFPAHFAQCALATLEDSRREKKQMIMSEMRECFEIRNIAPQYIKLYRSCEN
ncbi:glycosyltransferase family 4 protein [Candidatus Omnitrophota bacterium]